MAEGAKAGLGSVYYVSPAGSNENPGTLAHPWRTISKAAESLTAGDTVYVRAGTYRERVVCARSGIDGVCITCAAYPGETVTIDGSGIVLPGNWGGLFDISNRSHIAVSGLRFVNAGPHSENTGILVDGSAAIVIRGCYTYNSKR